MALLNLGKSSNGIYLMSEISSILGITNETTGTGNHGPTASSGGGINQKQQLEDEDNCLEKELKSD